MPCHLPRRVLAKQDSHRCSTASPRQKGISGKEQFKRSESFSSQTWYSPDECLNMLVTSCNCFFLFNWLNLDSVFPGFRMKSHRWAREIRNRYRERDRRFSQLRRGFLLTSSRRARDISRLSTRDTAEGPKAIVNAENTWTYHWNEIPLEHPVLSVYEADKLHVRDSWVNACILLYAIVF